MYEVCLVVDCSKPIHATKALFLFFLLVSGERFFFFFLVESCVFLKRTVPWAILFRCCKELRLVSDSIDLNTVVGRCAINEGLFNLGRITALTFSKLPRIFFALKKIFPSAATRKKKKRKEKEIVK